MEKKRKKLTLDRQSDHIYEWYFDEKDYDENDVVWKRRVERWAVAVEFEFEQSFSLLFPLKARKKEEKEEK